MCVQFTFQCVHPFNKKAIDIYNWSLFLTEHQLCTSMFVLMRTKTENKLSKEIIELQQNVLEFSMNHPPSLRHIPAILISIRISQNKMSGIKIAKYKMRRELTPTPFILIILLPTLLVWHGSNRICWIKFSRARYLCQPSPVSVRVSEQLQEVWGSNPTEVNFTFHQSRLDKAKYQSNTWVDIID